MASDYKIGVSNANAQVAAGGARYNSGYLRIYSNVSGIPATCADGNGSNVLLAELLYGATAFGSPSAGAIAANAITADSDANASGNAAYYRSYNTDGTTCEDQGTVGTADADLILNRLDIQSGGTVSVSGYTVTQPLE